MSVKESHRILIHSSPHVTKQSGIPLKIFYEEIDEKTSP